MALGLGGLARKYAPYPVGSFWASARHVGLCYKKELLQLVQSLLIDDLPPPVPESNGVALYGKGPDVAVRR